MGYLRTLEPSTEPITLAEAKAQCSVDTSDFDDLLNALIVGSRSWVENYLRRSLITQTWHAYFDEFPANDRAFNVGPERSAETYNGYRRGTIYLPFPPLISVTSLKYVAIDGTLTTLVANTDYQVETTTGAEARIIPAYNASWPATRLQMEAVQVIYTAGYGAASDVPQPIKQAMLLLIAAWFKNREATADEFEALKKKVPFAVECLLDSYKVWRSA